MGFSLELLRLYQIYSRTKRSATDATTCFPFPPMSHITAWMGTITVILEADVDGTLHLPLPAEFREGKVRVTATLEPAPLELEIGSEEKRATPRPGSLTGFCMTPDFDEPLEDFSAGSK